MSVDEVVELEVVVVLTERVDQRLGDLHPSNVEDELEMIGCIKSASNICPFQQCAIIKTFYKPNLRL